MNPELHHKWNDARDSSRGSNHEGTQVQKEKVDTNKVKLKQSKPR
jgi:hypothetical protein